MFASAFAVVWLLSLVVMICMALRLALRLTVGAGVLAAEALAAKAMRQPRVRVRTLLDYRDSRRAPPVAKRTSARNVETDGPQQARVCS
jgi:hypothetical protein